MTQSGPLIPENLTPENLATDTLDLGTLVPGPRKLVLIDSAVYPYAEIDLEESVHLSGRNNAGKSSLLNALQFLYIDDIKLMHFPNSNFQGKTKPFYFKPHGRSTILIEADTKWGKRTVGFHGLGAAHGCDWQRFGFEGPYEKDDFIDPETEQPRLWEDVKVNLSFKGYVELTQSQLRSALRGSGDKHPFRLELVPSGGNYDTFIEVFRQLLTLRKSKPEDLKNLLISVVEPELVSGDEKNRGVVSLASVVGEDYTKAFAAKQRYDRIFSTERTCQNLFLDFDRLKALQEKLPETSLALYGEACARLHDRRKKIADAQESIALAQEDEERWDIKRRSLDSEIREHNRLLGKEQGRLEVAREAKARLECETKELLLAKLQQIRNENARILVDLSAYHGAKEGGRDGAQELKSRAAKLKNDRQGVLNAIQNLQVQAENTQRAAWMDLLSEYPEEERDPLLKLINPAILRLPDGENGIQILSDRELGRVISVTAAAAMEGVFKGCGVKINMNSLPLPGLSLEDPLLRERELERYEAQVRHLDQEIKRLEELAENSKTLEKLKETHTLLTKEETELNRKIAQISGDEDQAANIPVLEITVSQMEAKSRQMDESKEESLEEHARCASLVRVYKSRILDLQKDVARLQEEVLDGLEQRAFVLGLDLFPEHGEFGAPEMQDDAFYALHRKLEEDWNESTRLDRLVDSRISEVENALDGMIAGDREQKLEMLRDLIEALPDQKAQLDATWQHIAVTAKTSFSNLLRDFETLSARVARLNRAMAKFSVSNLSGIQLRLVENSSKTEVLRRFTQEEGLFADASLAESSKEQVGEWIKQGVVFRLFDLFRVEIAVEKDGEKQIYASLDAESTGTAITLKVIFLAHLLRDLYRTRTDVRLLIFVDEVDTLDDVNQETIRECAKELGFTLIMASPNPANARRLYFLRPEGKVTHIYAEESLEVDFLEMPPVDTLQDRETVDHLVMEAVGGEISQKGYPLL